MQKLMTIRPPDWARGEAVRTLMRVMNSDGVISRFVGGAVRDAIMKLPVRDVDIASTGLAPDNMQRLRDAGITVHPTGLKHGTITAVLAHQGFEITTLRKDLETDGRHAKVVATDDWQADAERRDLTMNALYLDLNGSLYDPVGGYADVQARRIRFIGEASHRVAEDYLRILRFFRFFAWYGSGYGSGELDPQGLAACAAASEQIATLSKERISHEMLKLLAAVDPFPTLLAMQSTGVLQHSLSFAANLPSMQRLMSAETSSALASGALEVDPMRRLAGLCLGMNRGTIENRLSLSRYQQRYLDAVLTPSTALPAANDLPALRSGVYYQGGKILRDRYLLHGDVAMAQQAAALKLGIFPLKGRDLLARGIKPGPDVGRILADMEAWWLENGAGPSRRDCLAELESRLADLSRL
jgi:poly(A) polymerase